MTNVGHRHDLVICEWGVAFEADCQPCVLPRVTAEPHTAGGGYFKYLEPYWSTYPVGRQTVSIFCNNGQCRVLPHHRTCVCLDSGRKPCSVPPTRSYYLQEMHSVRPTSVYARCTYFRVAENLQHQSNSPFYSQDCNLPENMQRYQSYWAKMSNIPYFQR